MTLIKCSNCGKEYSDLLSSCKYCKNISKDEKEKVTTDYIKVKDSDKQWILRKNTKIGIFLFWVLLVLFIYIQERPPSPCECIKAYDEMIQGFAYGDKYGNDSKWTKCNRKWKDDAEEAWLKKNPNPNPFLYNEAWGAYENTGMVKAFLEKKCNGR